MMVSNYCHLHSLWCFIITARMALCRRPAPRGKRPSQGQTPICKLHYIRAFFQRAPVLPCAPLLSKSKYPQPEKYPHKEKERVSKKQSRHRKYWFAIWEIREYDCHTGWKSTQNYQLENIWWWVYLQLWLSSKQRKALKISFIVIGPRWRCSSQSCGSCLKTDQSESRKGVKERDWSTSVQSATL